MYQITAGISLLLHLVEMSLRLWVAVEYYNQDNISWSIATCTMVLAPMIFMNIISVILIFIRTDFEDKYCGRIVCCGFHFLQFGELWRIFKIMLMNEKQDMLEFCTLRLVQWFISSLPYLILQLNFMMQNNVWSTVAVISLTLSVISGACIFTLCNIPLKRYASQNGSHLQGFLYFLWKLFMLISRLIAIATFTFSLQFWILLIFIVHWTLIFLWSQTMDIFPTNVEIQKSHKHRFIDAVKCVIHCLEVLTISKTHRWKILMIFYGIVLLENALMIVIWYTGLNTDEWYAIPAVVIVFASFISGILFMFMYFQCLSTKLKRENENSSDFKDIVNNLDFLQEDMLWDHFEDDKSSFQETSVYENPSLLSSSQLSVTAATYDQTVTLQVPDKDKIQNQRRKLPDISGYMTCHVSNTGRLLPGHKTFKSNAESNLQRKKMEDSKYDKHSKLSSLTDVSSTSRNTHTLEVNNEIPSIITRKSKQARLHYRNCKEKIEKLPKSPRKLPSTPTKTVQWYKEPQTYDNNDKVESFADKKADSEISDHQRHISSDSHYNTYSSSSLSDDNFTMTRSRGFDYHANLAELSGSSDDCGSLTDSDIAMTWPPSNPKFTIENLTNLPNYHTNLEETVATWLQRINQVEGPRQTEASNPSKNVEANNTNCVKTTEIKQLSADCQTSKDVFYVDKVDCCHGYKRDKSDLNHLHSSELNHNAVCSNCGFQCMVENCCCENNNRVLDNNHSSDFILDSKSSAAGKQSCCENLNAKIQHRQEEHSEITMHGCETITNGCNSNHSEDNNDNANHYRNQKNEKVKSKKKQSFSDRFRKPIFRISSISSDLGILRPKKKKKKKLRELEKKLSNPPRPRRVISIESMV